MTNISKIKTVTEEQVSESLGKITTELWNLIESIEIIVRNIVVGTQGIEDIRNMYAMFANQCIQTLREGDII